MTSQLEAVIASNEATEPEYRIPTEGLEINGAKIFQFKKTRERIKGDCFASWVVLAQRENEFHQFAVWNLIARPDGFTFEGGDYYHSLLEADAQYVKRTLWCD
jgi:hypothetical protein